MNPRMLSVCVIASLAFAVRGEDFEWSGAITATGTIPAGRGSHTSVVYGDYMFVFGGSGSGNELKNDLHTLTLSTNT